MLAVKLADGFSVDFRFRKIADDEVEAIEVVTTERFRTFASHDNFVTESSESLFEQNTQLIVIIHDENPPFFHQTPIFIGSLRRDFDWLYENLSPYVRNISETPPTFTGTAAFTGCSESC
jgi:hypothetical protein